MPTKKEKTLLAIMGVVLLLVAGGIGVSFGLSKLTDARQKIVVYETHVIQQAASLPAEKDITAQRDALKVQLQDITTRFYNPGEMDPYQFGDIIKKKLAADGIKVTNYQIITESGKTTLEFSVTGSARSMVLFLKEVSEAETIWNMATFTLTLREKSLTADAVFRIGYEVITPAKNG